MVKKKYYLPSLTARISSIALILGLLFSKMCWAAWNILVWLLWLIIWLVDRLIAWLVDWLIVWLSAWLIAFLASLFDLLIAELFELLFWMAGFEVRWLIDWYKDWFKVFKGWWVMGDFRRGRGETWDPLLKKGKFLFKFRSYSQYQIIWMLFL